MPRRLMVPSLAPGPVTLEPAQAHHARDVLRLQPGDTVELFTPAGQFAIATLIQVSPAAVIAQVAQVQTAPPAFQLTIASAIPKGPRADWMIEKLSELGVARFIPLLTRRSIVHPQGSTKLDRWQRLASEASRQSGRTDVMQIAPLTTLADLLSNLPAGTAAYLSTEPDATPFVILRGVLRPEGSSIEVEKAPQSAIGNRQSAMPPPTLLIGPEGGWSPDELDRFRLRHLTPLTLGRTILRVETAAIAAAAVVAALLSAVSPPQDGNSP